MGRRANWGYNSRMTEPSIRDFHAHIYYDPEQVELAKQLAGVVQVDSFAVRGHEAARLATELAERVLRLAAERAAERNRRHR